MRMRLRRRGHIVVVDFSRSPSLFLACSAHCHSASILVSRPYTYILMPRLSRSHGRAARPVAALPLLYCAYKYDPPLACVLASVVYYTPIAVRRIEKSANSPRRSKIKREMTKKCHVQRYYGISARNIDFIAKLISVVIARLHCARCRYLYSQRLVCLHDVPRFEWYKLFSSRLKKGDTRWNSYWFEVVKAKPLSQIRNRYKYEFRDW